MKNCFIVVYLFLQFANTTFGQEHNPLINSAEIINEGIKLYDAGKYKDALALYKKINRSDTNYVWALYESALTYSADSEYNAAIHTCETALAEKTDAERVPDLLTEYGSLFDNIGETARSLQVFDSAIQLYPAYSVLYLNKGTTLLRAKRLTEAEQVFQHAILLDPYSASSHFKLGIIALQTGRVVPAMFSFLNYLLISPEGRYSNNCISLLAAIAKNTDEIKGYTDSRTGEPAEEYALVEQIIQSKIALDKNYKPIIELDDAISRQMQVLLEKLPYASDSKDFWMQYYVPYYSNVFASGKFEDLVNYIFSGVKVAQIENYNKKKKKEIQVLIDDAVAYFNKIRSTRELNYNLRTNAVNTYYFENGKFSGIGKMNAKGDKFIGDWAFYYPAGNKRSAGRFNDEGGKEATWLYYYQDGSLRAKQTYSNGKQNGHETFYFQNGVVSSEANYIDDNLEAEGYSYYYAGTTNLAAHYTAGKLNGERKQYFSNGSLRAIENFTNEKLNGKYLTYYKSGAAESAVQYLNGEIEGSYTSWHPNGKISIEGQYSKDKPTGQWKKYHENGQLKSIETFVNGKEEGEYTEYYDNGVLRTKYTYKKGSMNGEVTFNDEDGKPFSIFVFEDNRVIAAKYLDKAGRELGSSAFKDKKLDLVTYFTDGAKKLQATYNSKGNTEGKEINYYHCGKVSQTNEYSNGQLNGASVSYYLNDKKSNELSYRDDKKDGYYTSYHVNGRVASEGWYKDNVAEGQWLYYDELGNPTASSYFYNDELHGHKDEFYVNGRREYDTKYHFGWIDEMIQYDTTGKEISRIKMEKGSGKFTGLHLNGKTKFEGNYIQGDFEGPYKFYFFDGSTETTQFYKKGELDSTYKTYYYGGKLNIEGQYRLGKKVGVWRYYRITGTLRETQEYLDGETNGHSIFYFEDGKTDLDIMYKDGERNGPTKKYEPGGNLAYQLNYQDDLPVSYTYLNKDGKPVPAISFTAGAGIVKAFYPNGQLATEHAYKEGKIDGPYKLSYPNGKLWKEREDTYDITNGESKEYFDNGRLKASYIYVNDNLHGPYKEYNANGTLHESGNFYNGGYHGDIMLYDANGKLTETDTYYYGTLLSIKK